jgi:diguanylate cyclase (GGDEF)-like protein
VTALLAPLVVVTVVGVAMFRSSIGALEGFRRETVEEASLVGDARKLLGLADDVGERYVEEGDAGAGEEFRSVDRRIEASLDRLSVLSSTQEVAIVAEVRATWAKVLVEVDEAAGIPAADYTDAALDPFHDDVDNAASMLSDLYTLHGADVANEIASMRQSEQLQLVIGLATLLIGIAMASVVARWASRSITARLGVLERAADQFGADELSHRIDIGGDDELTRVGDAFNGMAVKLQRTREELQYQALHDPLTGLPNRALFMERVGHEQDRLARRSGSFALLYLDLDGFKAVNDSCGHHVGDELLQVAASRMSACLRPDDTLARLGGDEFGVLLEDTDREAATEVAGRLVHALGDTLITAHGLSIGASVGITTGGASDDIDDLLRQADSSMYSVKASGGGAWRVFDPARDHCDPRTKPLRTELQFAIERREFVVHYQPVVRFDTGAIESVEALVRWQHPERGLLAPSEFLDDAEATGQILFIDNWVMHEACRQVKSWQTTIPGASELSVCVNLSPSQLRHPGLAGAVAEALQLSGLRPQDLVIELTEGSLVHDIAAAATELEQMTGLGVRLALDDFGTGYSSMSHLVRFPVDIIKVDRSFVSAMSLGGQGSFVAAALVTLGRALGLEVIGEGIEEPHQASVLRSLGCELGQGHHFAKPMAADELAVLLGRGVCHGSGRSTAA